MNEDVMICPICGGYIHIDPVLDVGCCDTCTAYYDNGTIKETEL